MGMPNFESDYQHVPSHKPVRLSWLDQFGQIRCVAGRCIDVSSSRIHVEVPERIPLHTRVMLGACANNNAAFVKYVTPYNTKFILMLESR